MGIRGEGSKVVGVRGKEARGLVMGDKGGQGQGSRLWGLRVVGVSGRSRV